MITTNIPTLKIHKLTQEQYERELAAGNIDENALYLTPDSSASGGGGFIAANTAPENTAVLWIDTANGNIMKFYNGNAWVSVGSVWG